ncbi:MAG TPA: flagellar basal body-associated protein FliL [Dissulfurispiraceae bacterium]|nr:flagellar basal body-associated protein FliL [Dissulfurispiraceae bacterium]
MAKEKEEKPEGEEQAEEGKKKGGKKMLIIIISAIVVVLIGGGAAAYFLVLNKPKEAKDTKVEAKDTKQEEGVNFALDPFVVNLTDQGANKFLKISVQLELASNAVQEKAKVKIPQLRDAVISLLTSKSSDALMTPEGKLQLKDEINQRANQILGAGSVKSVYLTDFVMQ